MCCWFCLFHFLAFSFLFRLIFGPSQPHCVVISLPVSSFSSFLSGCHPGEPVLHCGGATCICRLVVVMVRGLWLQPPSLRSSQPLISTTLLHLHCSSASA